MCYKIKLLYVIVLGCTVVACNQREKLVKEYPKKIVGRWILDKQMMVVNAYDNEGVKDTTIGQEAGYKPAEIEYGSEGTFLLIIKDLNDDIKLRRPGRWEFSFDTLLLKDLNTNQVTERYIVDDMNDSNMEMRLTIDFDEDGKADDSYTGFYRRMIR